MLRTALLHFFCFMRWILLPIIFLFSNLLFAAPQQVQNLTAEEQASTGVTEDYVRVSVGTENINDIIADKTTTKVKIVFFIAK